jgi:hypothetical protein
LYRLFGEVSTSFLKFWEITDGEKWTFTQPCITLAEGEGSMAHLLILLGCPKVYFNTLIDQTRLVEQRAVSIVPLCLISETSKIYWGDLSALTGGNLSKTESLRHCSNTVLKHVLIL